MNKQEILKYLSEKKKLTAPIAIAEDEVNKAELNYDKAKKKWRIGIIVLLVLTIAYVWFCFTGNLRFFYFDENGIIQAGGIGGLILFGGLSALFIYIKVNHYVKPAEHDLTKALSILRQERNNPAYQNGSKDFPDKFYNYYDIYRLWNFINDGRADNLKEAYNLLETHQFQADQIAIQEDIRRLQIETANASKVTAAASVINAFNSVRKK